MANEPKTYVPKSSAKLKTFANGGSIMKLSFHAEALVAFVQQHKNERGWINLNVTERKTPSERGDTHSVSLDTWKPDGAGQTRPAETLPPNVGPTSDVPF